MALNLPDRLVPTDVIAVMITTEMSAAMSPYSMAVAPDWSLTKREIVLVMCFSFSCSQAIGGGLKDWLPREACSILAVRVLKDWLPFVTPRTHPGGERGRR